MPAGAYIGQGLQPRRHDTLPVGWLVGGDQADDFAVQPITTDLLGVYLFRSPWPASQDLDRPVAAVRASGRSAQDLADWIEPARGWSQAIRRP